MSIQDEIFDVADAVKGTDAEESFNRIMEWANENETNLGQLLENYKVLISAFRLVKSKDEVDSEFQELELHRS